MADTCSVAIHRSTGGCVLRVHGRGTFRESPAVRDFVSCAIERGADVVLDISECEFLDSTFLGCLVILHDRARRGQGAFTVCATELAKDKLLQSMRLDRILRVVPTCPDCMGPPVPLNVSELNRQELGRHLLETHRKLAELGGPAADMFRAIVSQLARELDSP
ncbi:MAG: STAS domain-containing protein [Pirellulaceae bacterium]